MMGARSLRWKLNSTASARGNTHLYATPALYERERRLIVPALSVGVDDKAPLAIVERGREERPCLVDDHRRRHQQPQREGELERDEERLGRAREHEPSAGHERRDRGLEEPDHVYPLDDEPADQRAHDDGEQAVQDAPAQLLEVVEERHLAARGWVRHGAPGARRGAGRSAPQALQLVAGQVGLVRAGIPGDDPGIVGARRLLVAPRFGDEAQLVQGGGRPRRVAMALHDLFIHRRRGVGALRGERLPDVEQRVRGSLVAGIDAQELAEPEPGGAEAATAVLLQGEVVHLRRARPDGVPGRTDPRPRAARVQRGHRLLGPLLESGPELPEALAALARQLLHRNELLLHADQVRADVAAELHQIGLLRRDRLLHGGEQFQHGVNLRGPVGIRPGGVGLQRRDLELDLPDITLEGAAGREPQAEDERYMARQRSPAYGCRNASPPERISNSSRRFCAHAVSSWPCAIGRSSPYDTVSMRPASMPWLTRYCFAAGARRLPRARVDSSDPPASPRPENPI